MIKHRSLPLVAALFAFGPIPSTAFAEPPLTYKKPYPAVCSAGGTKKCANQSELDDLIRIFKSELPDAEFPVVKEEIKEKVDTLKPVKATAEKEFLPEVRAQFCSNLYDRKDQQAIYQTIVGQWSHDITCCPTIPGAPPKRGLVKIGMENPGLMCPPEKRNFEETKALLKKQFPNDICSDDSPHQREFVAKWKSLKPKIEDTTGVDPEKSGDPKESSGPKGPVGPKSALGQAGGDSKDDNTVHDGDDTSSDGRAESTGQSRRVEFCGRDKLNQRDPKIFVSHYYEVWVKAVGDKWVLAKEGEPGASCQGMILNPGSDSVTIRGRVVPSFTDSNGQSHSSEVLGFQVMDPWNDKTDLPYPIRASTYYTVFQGARGDNLFIKNQCAFQKVHHTTLFLETSPSSDTVDEVKFGLDKKVKGGISEIAAGQSIARSSISSFTPLAAAADARPQ